MPEARSEIIRRDRVATRSRLLAAARREFAERGYDGTSVRRIAGAAGVDAALIFRYFGSKDGLFVAATAGEDPAGLLGRAPAEFADGLLSLLAFPAPGTAPPVAALLRSGTRVEGQQRLQSMVCGPYLAGLASDLDGPDRELRAELVAAWVIGVAVMRGVIPGTTLAEVDHDTVAQYSRAVVDALLASAGH